MPTTIPELIQKARLTISDSIIHDAEELLKTQSWSEVATELGYRYYDPQNQDLAGAMLIEDTIRNGPQNLEEYTGVMHARLHPRVSEFMLQHMTFLEDLMKRYEWREYQYSFPAAMVLTRQYLARPTYDTPRYETPAYFYLRVIVGLMVDVVDTEGLPKPHLALGVEEQEVDNVQLFWVEKLYEEAMHHRVSFATPTLYSSGFNKAQMASCFLMGMEDSLESIFDVSKQMAKISQHCGGIGLNIYDLRKSTIGQVGVSSGIMDLALYLDGLIRYVNQTGIRSGAANVYIDPAHPDALPFIRIADKELPGSAKRIDNTIWLNWMFLKRHRGSRRWLQFCPATTPSLKNLHGLDYIKEYERLEALYDEWKGKRDLLYRRVHGMMGQERANGEAVLREMRRAARDEADWSKVREYELEVHGAQGHEQQEFKRLLKLVDFTKETTTKDIIDEIVSVQQRFGRPYLMNRDAVNAKSSQQNLGTIRCGNLCVEIVQFTSPEEVAVCNLGSITLGKYVKDGRFDFQAMGRNVRLMIMTLDRVIDINYYPVEEARASNMRHRPIGLGVCGWGDVVNALRLVPDSGDAFLLNKKIAACIYYNACIASAHLARVYGSYSTFEGSPMSKGKFQFDMWADEYETLKSAGLLNEDVRKEEDHQPLDPSVWGQEHLEVDGVALGESWDQLRAYCMGGMRNSTLIARMPTASSASLSGSTPSAELQSTNLYTRNIQSGTCTVVNRYLFQELRDLGLLTQPVCHFIQFTMGSVMKLEGFIQAFPHHVPDFQPTEENMAKVRSIQDRYRTMFEVSQKKMLTMARDAGIYVCQSTSTNLWLPDPTKAQLRGAMMHGFDLGLKTMCYYVRSMGAASAFSPLVDQEVYEYAQRCREEDGIPEAPAMVCRMEEGCVMCQA